MDVFVHRAARRDTDPDTDRQPNEHHEATAMERQEPWADLGMFCNKGAEEGWVKDRKPKVFDRIWSPRASPGPT